MLSHFTFRHGIDDRKRAEYINEWNREIFIAFYDERDDVNLIYML